MGVSCDPDATEEAAVASADRHVLDHALWLAEHLEAELRVVHVVDFIDAKSGLTQELLGALTDSLARELRAYLGDRGSVEFRTGKAWQELIAEADAWGADVIAVAPRRRSVGLTDRIFHGSTTSKLLRRAPCAVWVVVEEAKVPVKALLALVDDSEAAEEVVAVGRELGERLGAQRHVLQCLEYPEDVVLHRLPHARRALVDYHREVQERAQSHLRATCGEGWTHHTSDDWVVRAAPALVDEHGIDMVVLSAQSRRALAGMLGSTAEKILERQTRASTLIVRPAGWAKAIADLG